MNASLRKSWHRSATLSLAIGALACGLAGCAGDGSFLRDAAMASGVTGGEPRPAPDFVSRTRAPTVDFMPIGTPAPPRAAPAKDAAAVGRAEAEMEALRVRNEAKGAQARKAAAP